MVSEYLIIMWQKIQKYFKSLKKGEDRSVGDSEVCLKPITEHATKPTICFLKQITWGIIKQKKFAFRKTKSTITSHAELRVKSMGIVSG